MESEFGLLILTAGSLGLVHTLLGPDHYLPFVAMSSARRWSMRRTLSITALCGVGHVLGSVAIGAVGIVAGLSLSRLEWFEGFRGDIAAWGLIGFGVAYMVWGLRRAWRTRPHFHAHAHAGGLIHSHPHGHLGLHAHPHIDDEGSRRVTPWALFIVFVLGPCESLIPVLMYPAMQRSLWGTVAVVLVFGITTIVTMLAVVYLARRGAQRLRLGSLERYSHAIAGATLGLCGFGMMFLGL